MSIKIKKDGQVREFVLPATNIQVLDIADKFKKKDLENVIKEISDTEHVYVGEVDETKDGIWIDDGEILDNAEDNGVVERIKTYVDGEMDKKSDKTHNHDDRYYTEDEINSKLNDKVNGKNRIITNSNLSVLGLTFPVTCETLANAMSNGDVLFCDSWIISDAPTSYGQLFVMRESENRIEFQYRNCGHDANKNTINELYIASYRRMSEGNKWSGWLKVSTSLSTLELTPLNGWKNTYSDASLLSATINGNLVNLTGTIQNPASVGDRSVIANLPYYGRPNRYRRLMGGFINNNGRGESFALDVATNGDIIFFGRTLSANTVMYVNCTFNLW